MNPSFSDLSEVIPDENKPPLLRNTVPASFPIHSMAQSLFRENGYVIVRGLIPNDLIDAYCSRFITDRGSKSSPIANGVWRPNVPYVNVPELRDLSLYPPLMSIMESLIGHEMGLHLNLIEWTSTERDFHQDDYLNPEYINNHYLAVWFALNYILPESGPFEFIPGSHTWPLMRRSKVFDFAPNEMKALPNFHADWPSLTQEFVSNALSEEIDRRNGQVESFIPASKGDILIWSGSLVHRGSYPKVRGMERRALISHYSSVEHRHDMSLAERHNGQGLYFIL